MTHNDERWLNQYGLNLIRIVIGSYFAAVALDLVAGFEPGALFAPFVPPMVADMIGSILLFSTSLAFMTGIYLRVTALMLALFAFTSSLMQNFVLTEIEDVSAFWRDITLVCAVVLNYSNMNRVDLRRADMMRNRQLAQVGQARKVQLPTEEVTPRRIAPSVFGKASKKPAAPQPDATALTRASKRRKPTENWSNVESFVKA